MSKVTLEELNTEKKYREMDLNDLACLLYSDKIALSVYDELEGSGINQKAQNLINKWSLEKVYPAMQGKEMTDREKAAEFIGAEKV